MADAKKLLESARNSISAILSNLSVEELARDLRMQREERNEGLAKIPSEDCHEKYRELPPAQHAVPDHDLPFKHMVELVRSFQRYNDIFESPSNTMHPQPQRTWTPVTLGDDQLIPWIIEAPLNSVEILEALLRPSHPFEIHTARHVQRRCSPQAKAGNKPRRLYDEYIRLQGQLELHREISYICIPRDAAMNMHYIFYGELTPVVLNYVSIPWGEDWKCPWAFVLQSTPSPGTGHTYENSLRNLLEDLEISKIDREFRRSLLKHGTTPLPECLMDWFAGRPGTTAALPYFGSAKELEANRRDGQDAVQRAHGGKLHLVGSCCIPILDGETAYKERERVLGNQQRREASTRMGDRGSIVDESKVDDSKVDDSKARGNARGNIRGNRARGSNTRKSNLRRSSRLRNKGGGSKQ